MQTAPRERGEEIRSMLERLRGPRPVVRVERPCTLADGIDPLEDWEGLEQAARGAARDGRVGLFVPAAGAATRFLGPVRALAEGEPAPELRRRATELAVWPEAAGTPEATARRVLEAWGGQPKGLVPFHRGPDGRVRTAVEEHLREAIALGASAHFVVSPDHLDGFRAHVVACLDHLQGELGVRPEVSLSVQSEATRTVALGDDGEAVRHDDGSLLWRPGGHGALLGNLAALKGDIVLVENVDNVAGEHWRHHALPWRRRLVGAVVQLQERVHGAMEALDAGRVDADALDPLLSRLGWPSADGREPDEIAGWLDRPLRVCGMVPNAGQPGGGPFWVHDPDDGVERRQIVEGVHLDTDDPEQAARLAASTHFNPVDLAVAICDAHGEPYDLSAFTDDSAWIVTDKTWRGRPLRALERPGLWNGGMGRWNTVFVELPPEAFTPVKTVLDLLHPAHLEGS